MSELTSQKVRIDQGPNRPRSELSDIPCIGLIEYKIALDIHSSDKNDKGVIFDVITSCSTLDKLIFLFKYSLKSYYKNKHLPLALGLVLYK